MTRIKRSKSPRTSSLRGHGRRRHGRARLAARPAPERNKRPIADVLRQVLPERGVLLEIASGTGQHAVHFVNALPGWTVQPSDADPEHLATLAWRVALHGDARLAAPVLLDVTAAPPSLEPTAIFCANMIHIAPFSACVGLFTTAAGLLREGQPLVTYGPYSVHGEHTAESNERFDRSLRARNPEWGVRDVHAVAAVAREHDLRSRRRTRCLPTTCCSCGVAVERRARVGGQAERTRLRPSAFAR